MNRLVRVLPLGLLLAACGTDEASRPLPSARLLAMGDCGAAADYIRKVAIDRVNQTIDAEIQRYESGDNCSYNNGAEDGQSPPSGTGGSGSGSGPTTGTGTNNQVDGVDEADFVKNDGQYIYLAQNGVLRIVDSWPADQTHTVSTTPLEGEPKKLFIDGDTALVYTAIGDTGGGYWNRECTYGYDCDFTGDGTATRILVYNITDRTAPHLERQVDLSGSLIAARKIGTAVHTVVTKAANPFPDLSYYPEGVNLCGYGGLPAPWYEHETVIEAYNELRAANIAKIKATPIDVLLPSVRDSLGSVDASDGPSCTDLYASSIADGTAYTSIVSLDMSNPGPVKAATIISRAGAVYSSADALYIAVPHAWDDGSSTEDLSTIHKFRVSEQAGQTRYLASGHVEGRALNQFAMDEQDGYLRIATTDGHVPSPDVVSYLSVLAEQNDALVTVGQIGDIAPGEDIRSVRFDGDRAFIVTFKKTDPLFTFDVSNPTSPTLLGELKIPGFSTYMHMLDATHLLTIGYDADDHDTFAYFDGILLQIFDVTDMNAPALLHRLVIGTRGSSSEALVNHLAFTWYPERNLLSLPMTICEGGDDGVYGDTMTFNGLMVFDASVAGGIAEHGRIPSAVAEGITCGNWWADATSSVKRSLFLDQYVYSISDIELKVRDVGALGTELVTVPLQ